MSSDYVTNMKEWALIFDIPNKFNILKVKTNRALKLASATMIQKSVWKSKNFNDLLEIALMIKQHGGKAEIVEWKPVAEI